MDISLATARLLLLHAQGLLARPTRPARRADVLAAIRRMGVLQIDTINIVARSPYFVLYSRLGAYEPRWLDELHAAGKLFEYWAHAMCWLPAEDWPLYRGLMLAGMRERTGHWPQVLSWLDKHREAAEMVVQHIRERGALRSSDFVREAGSDARPTGAWWDWKLEKAALEYVFTTGELLIARRDKFQRVYDLRERVLPDWDDARAVPAEDARCELLRRAAKALGVATEPWLRDYYRFSLATTRWAIKKLMDSDELLTARIEGLDAPAYIHRDSLPLLRKAQRGALTAELTTLLSPFDPLVWDRRRLRELFGFDYMIECYTPAPKREYGYFTLPILHRGALIGRLDPKAHRKDGVFEIRALHLEPGVKLSAADARAVAAAIRDCAAWHQTPKITLGACEVPALRRQLAD